MKKTILFLVTAFVITSLSSCARGYGCQFTTDTIIHQQSDDIAQQNTAVKEETLPVNRCESELENLAALTSAR